MSDHELKMLTHTARGLFPTATVQEIGLVMETARSMQYNRALAVLKTHKRQHDFFSVKGLTEALTGDYTKSQAMRKRSENERVIDWLRRTDHRAAGLDDFQALREHFLRCVAAVNQHADLDDTTQYKHGHQEADKAQGRPEVLLMIKGHAIAALREINWSVEDAIEMVDSFIRKSEA